MIAVGKKFNSFDDLQGGDLERNIKLFEEKNFVKFWKRQARTIEAAKKCIECHINPKLNITN